MTDLDFSGLDALQSVPSSQASEDFSAPRLERTAQGIAEERQRIAAAYKEYQENIKQSFILTAEIAKGMQAGESISSLFLKAMDAIGRMTGDRQLLDRTRSALISVYGVGLRESEPLEMEKAAIRSRLAKLEAARETAAPDHREQIERAIRAHRQLLDQ